MKGKYFYIKYQKKIKQLKTNPRTYIKYQKNKTVKLVPIIP